MLWGRRIFTKTAVAYNKLFVVVIKPQISQCISGCILADFVVLLCLSDKFLDTITEQKLSVQLKIILEKLWSQSACKW